MNHALSNSRSRVAALLLILAALLGAAAAEQSITASASVSSHAGGRMP